MWDYTYIQNQIIDEHNGKVVRAGCFWWFIAGVVFPVGIQYIFSVGFDIGDYIFLPMSLPLWWIVVHELACASVAYKYFTTEMMAHKE